MTVLAASTFCGAPSDSMVSPNAYSILDGLRDHLEQAHATGDAQTIADVFDSAGSLQLPQEPAVTGRASIEARYVQLFEVFTVSLSMMAAESSARDGRAVDRGTFDLSLSHKAGGANVHWTGDYSLEGSLGEGGVRVERLRFESSS